MQIQFVRAGGFAGPATRVAGTLTFESAAAQVTSSGTGYRRDLPPSEAGSLRTAGLQSAQDKVQEAPAGSLPVPDGLEYRITITADDGKTHTLTVHGDSASPEMNRLAPNTAILVRWVQQEAEAIWQYRLRNRP